MARHTEVFNKQSLGIILNCFECKHHYAIIKEYTSDKMTCDLANFTDSCDRDNFIRSYYLVAHKKCPLISKLFYKNKDMYYPKGRVA